MRLELLKIEITRVDGVVHVTPIGEVDLSNAHQLAEALNADRFPGSGILLDLSRLSFMDSTGLKILIEADAASRANGHSFQMTEPTGAVRRVFEISGLLRQLPVVEGS